MVFAENLRKCREKAGLSQTALGAKMGLKGSFPSFFSFLLTPLA